MPIGDHDPSGERPIIEVERNGSHIKIVDVEGTLQDARRGQVSIYDRSDFGMPIERLQMTAETRQEDEGEVLSLGSVIQLDRTGRWNSEWLNARFDRFAEEHRETDYTQAEPPFLVEKRTFANSHLVTDQERGSRFIVWIRHEDGQVLIENDTFLSNDEYLLETRPHPLHTLPAEKQLESLALVTAMTADFVAAFQEVKDNGSSSAEMQGIPLKREYVIGSERRPIKAPIRTRRATPERPGSEDTTEKSESSLEAEIGIERPDDKIRLEDIGGLADTKQLIKDIAATFVHAEVMEKWGAKRPQGVLLYGEPGTGKTMLAHALASEIDAEMWEIKSSDIYEKWLGSSEQKIKELFSVLRRTENRVVVFFDEFDSIVGITEEPSAGGADNARNAVAGIFKQEMNTLATENPNILLVAATNDLDRINPALMRPGRFDHKIYVPMPDQEARQQILGNVVAKSVLIEQGGEFHTFTNDLDIPEIARVTDGMSGADIHEIVRRLLMKKAMTEARTERQAPPISQEDLIEQIREYRENG